MQNYFMLMNESFYCVENQSDVWGSVYSKSDHCNREGLIRRRLSVSHHIFPAKNGILTLIIHKI